MVVLFSRFRMRLARVEVSQFEVGRRQTALMDAILRTFLSELLHDVERLLIQLPGACVFLGLEMGITQIAQDRRQIVVIERSWLDESIELLPQFDGTFIVATELGGRGRSRIRVASQL